ncbi:protein CNPPD1-like [Amphibalanus amphitrite]|uniref:protein CNPPD1-like n=1 Tax=Amphibalanus amphitrite TaxID=1232801 RepID=UPI001C913828|nr:protein CNPPD1-like [Amphibalanus amphitrite]
MALGASKPSRREEFLCHRALSRRLKRSLYFGGRATDEAGSLPLMAAASREFSGRPGRQLRSLAMRDVTSITHQACISPAAVVMALVYLERLADLRPDYLRRTHPKHLFVTSTLAASKMLYDDGEQEQVFNDEWAASAEMTVDELNAAEIDFLNAMGWELYVPPGTFTEMLGRVEAGAALAESSQRGGWLTYSDLLSIGSAADLAATVQLLKDALIKVVAVCSVAYLASVMTLMSSVLLVFHAPPPAPVPHRAVFVARPPAAAPPAGSPLPPPSALLDQLCAAAASSGLLILAALNPLAGDSEGLGAGTADRPNVTERLSGEDMDDTQRPELQSEVPTATDRWLEETMNDTWRNLRSPAPDPDDPGDSIHSRLSVLTPRRLPVLTNAADTLPPSASSDLVHPAVTTSLPPWELANLTTAAGGPLWCRGDGRQRAWPRLGLLAVCS